jgi:PhnB protein
VLINRSIVSPVAITDWPQMDQLSSDIADDMNPEKLPIVPTTSFTKPSVLVPVRHSAGRPHTGHLVALLGGYSVQELRMRASLRSAHIDHSPHSRSGRRARCGFHRDALGGEEVSRIPVPDGRLMSVQLRIADGLLHLADEFPEMGVLAPPSIGGTPVVLALDVADAEAVFAQAVAAGAAIHQPLADMFWGDRHGQLEDPFGHRWSIGQHLRDVPRDELAAAAAQAFS